jgi:F-type H+-transporting ATPase subunit gamma
MAASLRDLRRKIKSIQSTKKLTQAMQMVAASKMQKSIRFAESGREYSRLSWEIIKNIKQKTDISGHPFLNSRPVKKTALILVTSNRGLCGGLNSQVIRKATDYISSSNNKTEIDIITIGNKGKIFAAKSPNKLVADFPAPDKIVEFSDVLPLSNLIFNDFNKGTYDKVVIFFNQFISTLTQVPVSRQILPIPDLGEIEEYELKFENKNNVSKKQENIKNKIEYLFEPDTKTILDTILPTIVKIQLHQILLESSASEHAARMIAMKNATDNASDLIDDLVLTYNGLRQDAITKEITEISAGAEALRT